MLIACGMCGGILESMGAYLIGGLAASFLTVKYCLSCLCSKFKKNKGCSCECHDHNDSSQD
jgi:hypothetical protein